MKASGNRSSPNCHAGTSLTEAAEIEALWRTPTTTELGYSADTLETAEGAPMEPGRRVYRTRPDGSKINSSVSLNLQAEMWATPSLAMNSGFTRDEEKRRAIRRGHDGNHLLRQAEDLLWPTASANDFKGSCKPGQRRRQLDEAAEHWATPTAEDAGESPGPRKGAPGLFQHAVSWAHGLQDRPTPTDGAQSSPSTRRRPRRCRLNATFVEWLMGFPRDWTRPFSGPTGCAPSGTGS